LQGPPHFYHVIDSDSLLSDHGTRPQDLLAAETPKTGNGRSYETDTF